MFEFLLSLAILPFALYGAFLFFAFVTAAVGGIYQLFKNTPKK